MDNAEIGNRFLKFKTDSGDEELVSIGSILDSGYPINSETGDDLELASNDILDSDGNPT